MPQDYFAGRKLGDNLAPNAHVPKLSADGDPALTWNSVEMIQQVLLRIAVEGIGASPLNCPSRSILFFSSSKDALPPADAERVSCLSIW